MSVKIECERRACSWSEEVSGTDTITFYCPSCAPDRRVRTVISHTFEQPENTKTDKI